MPQDIRSFFGGKPSQPSQTNGSAKAEPAKGKDTKSSRTKRKVLEDSDDDVTPRKSSPKKPPAKKRELTPQEETTTTSDYFGKGKPKRSSVTKPAPATTKNAKQTPAATPTKPAKNQPSPSTRSSGRKKPVINYNESLDANGKTLVEEGDGKDSVFEAKFKGAGKRLGDEYEESEGEESDIEVKPLRRTTGREKQTKIAKDAQSDDDVDMKDTGHDGDFVVPDDDEEIEVDRPAKKATSSTKGRKRKSPDVDDEEESSSKKPKSSTKSTAKPAPKKSAAAKHDEPENAEMQAIFDSIPLVRPPTPPPQADGEKPKYNPRAGHANSGPPPAAGSKEVPVGAENCLAGLSFVFTGLGQSLGREEGQALVKRYGGKVMGAPGKKTSYVVLGEQAGPKKLETIRNNGIKTIDEDGLFELIRKLPANGGDSKAAAAYQEKKEAEEQKIRELAAQVEKEERHAGGAGGAGVTGTAGKAKAASKGEQTVGKSAAVDNRLWTVKYAPTQLTQICGNKVQVERLQTWLKAFPKSLKTGFKLAGKDGMGQFRAVIISGPPGIGKTTAAHLVAKLEGYDIIESNASDTRSKKLVDSGLKGVLDTTSLLGYFAADDRKVEESKKRLVLIMDEVDGMSAGDRGGVGALAAVCKKTEVPMILICNDRKAPKMRPFDHVTYNMQFRRPTVDQIRSRIMTINFREGIKMPSNVVDALIEGTGADIRQVVNMISTAKTDQQSSDSQLDFDRGKEMSKAWEKHIVLKPWDIVSKILGGGLFAPSSKSTLNNKAELYFNDHEFSHLMLQENYLGTTPLALGSYTNPREKRLKNLELVEKAANSISEGDLVDRMIHGSEQHWSLMPTHAIFSFVRPASFVAGTMAGHQTRFTSWLGKNSAQGKLMRLVKEIQGHMRLRCSSDRHAIRQQYLPLLWTRLVKKLQLEGKDSVAEIIALMDSYYLTKEDWDAIQELGVGPMTMESVNIAAPAKAAFTRLYNAQSHPMPFMKASNVQQPKKLSKVKPDLEEAIDESDDEIAIDEAADEGEDEGDLDLSKDKYVKQPKKKKTPAAKGKGKSATEKEEDESEDVEQAKKGKAKAKPKAKGKK